MTRSLVVVLLLTWTHCHAFFYTRILTTRLLSFSNKNRFLINSSSKYTHVHRFEKIVPCIRMLSSGSEEISNHLKWAAEVTHGFFGDSTAHQKNERMSKAFMRDMIPLYIHYVVEDTLKPHFASWKTFLCEYDICLKLVEDEKVTDEEFKAFLKPYEAKLPTQSISMKCLVQFGRKNNFDITYSVNKQKQLLNAFAQYEGFIGRYKKIASELIEVMKTIELRTLPYSYNACLSLERRSKIQARDDMNSENLCCAPSEFISNRRWFRDSYFQFFPAKNEELSKAFMTDILHLYIDYLVADKLKPAFETWQEFVNEHDRRMQQVNRQEITQGEFEAWLKPYETRLFSNCISMKWLVEMTRDLNFQEFITVKEQTKFLESCAKYEFHENYKNAASEVLGKMKGISLANMPYVPRMEYELCRQGY